MTELTELAIVLGVATLFGLAAKSLRQPLIVAYLLTGVALAILHYVPATTEPLYKLFSDLGIMFLLFLIGLEINISTLKKVGPVSVVLGLGQLVITFVFGFFIGLFFNFDLLQAGYIAIALAFSSTVIVVKLLSEKHDLHSLYGKITVGFLLVQDVVAMILLLVLAGVEKQGIAWPVISGIVLQGILLFGAMILLGRYVMPKLLSNLSHSSELVFVAAIAWALIVVAIVQRLGFSIEIGGFLAGLALANSAEHFHIASRIRPLRDFFLVLFFVTLGSTLSFSNFSTLGWPILAFSLFVLIGNPLIVLILMGSMGYHRRTSFLAGITVAQISEFSLVLAALGLRLGHLDNTVVTLITAVGVVTIIASSYLILYAEKLYVWLEPTLRQFEKPTTKADSTTDQHRRPIVLIGADRTGQALLPSLKKSSVVIIDFNPDVVTALKKQGYQAVYGDITDPDIDEHIDFKGAKIIVSTSPNLEDNIQLVAEFSGRRGKKPLLISRAHDQTEAQQLYEAGADYVIIPLLTSGHFLGSIMSKHLSKTGLQKLRQQDQRWLKSATL